MKLKNTITNLPGDKSITHRAIMFSSLADGISKFSTSVLGRDNFSTIRIFQQLGVDIKLTLTKEMKLIALDEKIKNIETETSDGVNNIGVNNLGVNTITIIGRGIKNLTKPVNDLDCGNSGTTARLLIGLLSATNFDSTLIGDHSLSKRPFLRVTDPLTKMGAEFSGDMLPITVSGAFKNHTRNLVSTNLEMKKSSAQVKSALLIAGMYASGTTVVTEPVLSRDHTERMLSSMGVQLKIETKEDKHLVSVTGSIDRVLTPFDIKIPGDISGAMFYIVSALLSDHSGVLLTDVGINPTRSKCLDLLIEIGAKIEIRNSRLVAGEPVADLFIEKSIMKPFILDSQLVSQMIDEIPILSVLASFTEGESIFRGAEELRVKESDRILYTKNILNSFGIEVEEYNDGLRIFGNPSSTKLLSSNNWSGTGDHRIEMSASVMSFLRTGNLLIDDLKAIETSFPGFAHAWES